MNPVPAPPSVSADPTPMPGTPIRPAVRRRARFAWYVGTAIVALALATIDLRLDRTSLTAPFLYEDDVLLVLPMVKATLEGGTHWHTPRLGGWDGQQMHDFPVVDHLHFALLWLLGRFVPDSASVFNLYYLLGYPLAALTAMAVGRQLGLSLPAAAMVGVVYTMQPYHLARGENHYFLSAYWMVPVTLLLVFWILRGRLPFFPPRDGAIGERVTRRFSLTDRTTLLAVLIAALTASAGAYYAFFGCVFLLAGGLYAWAAGGGWRAFASASLVIGVVFAAGLANHAPAIVYQVKYGRNSAPTERISEESEYYGLKLTHLLLPIEGHSIRPLAEMKSTYNSYFRPVQSDSERHSLGTVGAVGVILLLARAFLPGRRGWPFAPLAALFLAGVLVGTVGGVGAIFNHVVSPQVRCYNRIVVYLALLALFAVAFELDRLLPRLAAWLTKRNWRHARLVVPVGCAAVAWFGVWDQTPYNWASAETVKVRAAQQERYRTDAKFFADIEGLLAAEEADERPMVFQLPYVKWPEARATHLLACYEHARGYLHTSRVGWSFGCMAGRETDEWYRRTVTAAIEPMLARVVKAGYDGLLLDKRGYTPARAALIHHQLNMALGTPGTLAHPDGQQIFFDLRGYRDWLRGQLGRGWDDACWAERHPVQVLWLDGWISYREPGDEWLHRWCGPKGLAVFVNPTDQPALAKVQFHARTTTLDPAQLKIDGGELWTEELEINKESPVLVREFVIPPGRHYVRFRCTMPPSHLPTEPKRLSFFLAGFRFRLD